MSNISKLEFMALQISGDNYMGWTANIKRYLRSMGVQEAIEPDNECTDQQIAKADVFIHKHIDNTLQTEYSGYQSPCRLRNDLKIRFDHQRESTLPIARNEWNNLRFQDFKNVNDYISALLNICSRLEFCGQTVTEEDKLEKTYSTFHASNINLQQQYRLQRFFTYAELSKYLIVAERNNELLMKNHNSRPTGSLAIPEAYFTYNNDHKNYGRKLYRGHEQGRKQGRGRGRGRGRGHFNKTHFSDPGHSFKWNNNRGRGRGRCRGYGSSQRANNYHVPQRNHQQDNVQNDAGTSKMYNNSCYRCGGSDHWAKVCCTPPHLCGLYQASQKGKEKEVNHIGEFDNINTELNNADFINEPEQEI